MIVDGECYVCQVGGLDSDTRHCKVCNKCVDGFDHHCPWINNCVGARTYRLFLVMLASGTVSSLGVVASCILAVQRHYEAGCTGGPPCIIGSSSDIGSGDGVDGSRIVVTTTSIVYNVFGSATFSSSGYVGLTALTALLALLGGVLLGDLALYHMVLRCKGVSTYTYWMHGQDPIPSHLYCCCFWKLEGTGKVPSTCKERAQYSCSCEPCRKSMRVRPADLVVEMEEANPTVASVLPGTPEHHAENTHSHSPSPPSRGSHGVMDSVTPDHGHVDVIASSVPPSDVVPEENESHDLQSEQQFELHATGLNQERVGASTNAVMAHPNDSSSITHPMTHPNDRCCRARCQWWLAQCTRIP